MKRMAKVLEFLEELGCKVFAVVLAIVGAGSVITGAIGILDCLTGGNSITYLTSFILVAVGFIFGVVLTHMPKRFYDNLEF